MSFLHKRDCLYGAFIYGTGDTVASLLTGEFQVSRMVGMMLLGGTLYAFEIPRYFAWIDRRFGRPGLKYSLLRALLAQAFFNPLWIARHLALIHCFSGQFEAIQWHLIDIGLKSFLRAVPYALFVNYSIQNLIPLKWRFFASAVFSAGMALYYALSGVLFV